ncbi:hypothetical protein N802_04315 [Knoellia sinensis KCTC 19936]|uniref:GatB/YqeY n=1 Tax=Knoellia sinensis KCTC 19936 TaxID=1385520 RepID=A0A0A0J3P1_9MICO|nr:GatB/YqeY domain-containing protein [Knoellia sinensis]KGN31319.1 hypothetical protein N802_04315 [Knoellia sinensis KCTC 19936]
MTSEPTAVRTVDDLRATMRTALRTAMKDRDRPATSALRSALGAIDNAEAVPTEPASFAAHDAPIAGAVVGLGATEAARRELTVEDVHSVLRAEIAERREVAGEIDAAGRPERAADLRREADVLEVFTASP